LASAMPTTTLDNSRCRFETCITTSARGASLSL
jgi:hypothetical protein